MSGDARYYVMRATTRQMLTRDADLTDGGDTLHALSSVGSATFLCEPGHALAKASDGKPLYDKWSSIIIAEVDGAIDFAGIVTDSVRSGKTWTLTCDSIATAPHGVPFDSRLSVAETDPADIMRAVWAHVQSYPDADVNVRVVGSTPIRVGSTSTAELAKADAALAAAKAATKAAKDVLKGRRDDVAAARKVYSGRVDGRVTASKAKTAALAALAAAKRRKPKDQAAIDAAQREVNARQAAIVAADGSKAAQQRVIDDAVAAVKWQQDRVDDREKEQAAASAVRDKASQKEQEDGGAYTLSWWEATDCGGAIDQLVSDFGFEWTEHHYWTDRTKSDIRTDIVVHYPRAGTESDLVFEQGVNVTNVVTLTDSGDDYANAEFGVGAGEGPKSVRASVAIRDGRLRRVRVRQDKGVKSRTVLEGRLRSDLRHFTSTLQFGGIDVVGTDSTKIGAWSLGDDITIVADVEHYGRARLRHRITDWTRTGPNTASLTVKRSDSFIYGG